jgi:hypothetical protein
MEEQILPGGVGESPWGRDHLIEKGQRTQLVTEETGSRTPHVDHSECKKCKEVASSVK